MKQPLSFYFLLFCLLGGPFLLGQQERGLGMTLEDPEFGNTPVQSPVGVGEKSNTLRLVHSLRDYAPLPTDQGRTGSCVGHAVRSAFTMEKAIKNGIRGRDRVTEMLHSPGYVYNQIQVSPCSGCGCGSRLSDALQILMRQGICLSETFPTGDADCTVQPTDAQREEAAYFKIKDYAAAWSIKATPDERVAQTIKQLQLDKPVVIGLQATSSLWEVKPGQTTWNVSDNDKMLGGHAMVAIGYNAAGKYITLLNSYGPNWGNEGTINIAFDDYAKLVRFGYIITLREETPLAPPNQPKTERVVVLRPVPQPGVSPVESRKKPVIRVSETQPVPQYDPSEYERTEEIEPTDVVRTSDLRGGFYFRHPTGTVQNDAGETVIQFAKADAAFHPQTGTYELVRKDWRVNDVFQLMTRELRAGEYVYVYSIDAKNKLEKHWPDPQGLSMLDNVPLSAVVPSSDAEIAMPGADSGLQIAHPGKDRLVVLYSKHEISDVDSRMDRVHAAGDGFAAVRREFADVLIPAEQINYALNDMSFDVRVPEATGTVVPVLLTVEAK